MDTRLAPACAALALAAGLPLASRADAPAPEGYAIHEDPAGTVQVCLVSYDGRSCDGAEVLLRRDTASGDVVAITACDADHCFLDQGVPPGTYQYGLQTPYACPAGAHGDVLYYVEAAVAGVVGLGAGASEAPPLSVPWLGQGQLVCAGNYSGLPFAGPSCDCTSGGPVLGFDLLALLAGALLWRGHARRARA